MEAVTTTSTDPQAQDLRSSQSLPSTVYHLETLAQKRATASVTVLRTVQTKYVCGHHHLKQRKFKEGKR